MASGGEHIACAEHRPQFFIRTRYIFFHQNHKFQMGGKRARKSTVFGVLIFACESAHTRCSRDLKYAVLIRNARVRRGRGCSDVHGAGHVLTAAKSVKDCTGLITETSAARIYERS